MRFVKDETLHLRVVKKSLLKIPKRKVKMMAYSSGNLLPKQIKKYTLVACDCILRNIQCDCRLRNIQCNCILRNIQCTFIFHLYFHLNNLQ
jgi:hypothetical protein